ncbi:unnamed protein product [Parascedosporium putredinis]|uniref:Zn(2)-C6 fungal-type domain-containing protein n=1 Tax=Parascedosporium putredinis TaxID=1442378 RepID=A0A9P1H748_9PEZI|nr:unnamed protein product [Parascedosporium putredinis]CAI7999361.1 unnamed protein product [Parascedosporium putredinis]
MTRPLRRPTRFNAPEVTTKTVRLEGIDDTDMVDDHDHDHDQDHDPDGTGGDGDNDPAKPSRKRQRVRLSCLECRRRKLSCNRALPCDRCIRSETPGRCQYETRSGKVINAASDYNSLPPDFRRLDTAQSSIRERDHERIRKLEHEIVQLRKEMSRQRGSLEGSTPLATTSPSTQAGEQEAAVDETRISAQNLPFGAEKGELRFVRFKEFRTRFLGPHSAAMAMAELTGLSPFMKETADELLRSVKLHDRKGKDRKRRTELREKLSMEPDLHLESLLPTKEESDALITVYLDIFEQLHRIIHIPTFRRDYARFWDPPEARPPGARRSAFTALVLSIMSISCCLYSHPTIKFVGMMSDNHSSAVKWVTAVDDWLARQSQKHRRLIHYQIACLLYLGKRVNTIKKKRFWTGAGALVQDGISLGLHRDTRHMAGKMSAYNQEMRRRIWATVQELDMQASFDFGLPTLLSQVHYDVAAPSNLDDNEFNEETVEIPHPGPQTTEPRPLRTPNPPTDYDDIVQYTNNLMREIDALPSWDQNSGPAHSSKKPILAYTLLHIQLRQYILPMHQQYVKTGASTASDSTRYQYSENVSYNAARDIVLLHDKLYEQGVQALNFLREDTLTTAIKLCSVTMLQPQGSTNMIMINARHTVELIEKCIAMKEDRLLRSGNYEPWGFVFLYGALGLLQAHLNLKSGADAKASAIEKLKTLQNKLSQVRRLTSPDDPLERSMSSSSIGPSPPMMTFQAATALGARAGLVGPTTPGMMMTPDFPLQSFPNNFDFQPFPEQFLGDFFNLNVPETWPFNGV